MFYAKKVNLKACSSDSSVSSDSEVEEGDNKAQDAEKAERPNSPSKLLRHDSKTDVNAAKEGLKVD